VRRVTALEPFGLDWQMIGVIVFLLASFTDYLDGWLAPANRTSGGRPPGRSTVSRADSIDVVREPQR